MRRCAAAHRLVTLLVLRARADARRTLTSYPGVDGAAMYALLTTRFWVSTVRADALQPIPNRELTQESADSFATPVFIESGEQTPTMRIPHFSTCGGGATRGNSPTTHC